MSKGPKTPAGKAASSKNARRHGLSALVPVLPGEEPEEWQQHRSSIVASLAPVGGLEQELAERVALALWRLRRAAIYETVTTAIGVEEVQGDLHDDAIRYGKSLPNTEPEPPTLRLARLEI
jgi:hypothetical protein